PGIGERNLLDAGVGEVAGRFDLQRAVARNHDDERVAEPAFAGGRVNQPLFLQPVHLCFVGGKENVGGSAFLNLPRERAGGGEVENDFIAGLLLVGGGDFL